MSVEATARIASFYSFLDPFVKRFIEAKPFMKLDRKEMKRIFTLSHGCDRRMLVLPHPEQSMLSFEPRTIRTLAVNHEALKHHAPPPTRKMPSLD